MYACKTKSIEVSVKPYFMESESDPNNARYFWAYTIVITNHGAETVQLLTRHWEITDANGAVHVVQGDGVVGEQPVLDPGDSFQYTSGAPLQTSTGFMTGSYGMVNRKGERFNIAIPTFSLDSPHMDGAVH